MTKICKVLVFIPIILTYGHAKTLSKEQIKSIILKAGYSRTCKGTQKLGKTTYEQRIAKHKLQQQKQTHKYKKENIITKNSRTGVIKTVPYVPLPYFKNTSVDLGRKGFVLIKGDDSIQGNKILKKNPLYKL